MKLSLDFNSFSFCPDSATDCVFELYFILESQTIVIVKYIYIYYIIKSHNKLSLLV